MNLFVSSNYDTQSNNTLPKGSENWRINNRNTLSILSKAILSWSKRNYVIVRKNNFLLFDGISSDQTMSSVFGKTENKTKKQKPFAIYLTLFSKR